jgi:hypothetical protein
LNLTTNNFYHVLSIAHKAPIVYAGYFLSLAQAYITDRVVRKATEKYNIIFSFQVFGTHFSHLRPTSGIPQPPKAHLSERTPGSFNTPYPPHYHIGHILATLLVPQLQPEPPRNHHVIDPRHTSGTSGKPQSPRNYSVYVAANSDLFMAFLSYLRLLQGIPQPPQTHLSNLRLIL